MHPQRKLMIYSDVTKKRGDRNVCPLPLTQEMISKKYSVNNDKVLHTNKIATFIQTTTYILFPKEKLGSKHLKFTLMSYFYP